MLISTQLLGALCALASAGLWGGGDFAGGFATRRNSQFQVLALASFSGLVVLVGGALVRHEALLSPRGMLWAMAAGLAGAVGTAALYRALSLGHAASIAPTAAVVGAGLPVAFSIFTEGWPGPTRLAGFALALAGIWLVSQTSASGRGVPRRGLALAVLAGTGFAGFFILIAQVEPGPLFMPLAVVRSVSLGTALLLLLVYRPPAASTGASWAALLAGFVDVWGNVTYLLAKQFTRMDAATVLGSLYPAATVLLARLVLKEAVSRTQWLGVGLCLAAIALITV